LNSTELNYIINKSLTWHSFDKENVKNAPSLKGIYVIRMARGQLFGRLSGVSDILYVGSAESKGGLRQRLQQYFHPGRTQWTNLRIKELTKKYQMEVTWCPYDEPKNLEHELLRRYLKDHEELPPLNHASIRQLYKNITDKVRAVDEVSL
jgi:hypothetical protein